MANMLQLSPRLTPMLERTTPQYIEFWGAELYNDFCGSLGLEPMGYWAWEAATREQGVDWWCRDLKLEQIKSIPPVDDYCMLVRTAHPSEASGPLRLYHYVAMRIQAGKLSTEQLLETLWHELGGELDAEWYSGIVAHLATCTSSCPSASGACGRVPWPGVSHAI